MTCINFISSHQLLLFIVLYLFEEDRPDFCRRKIDDCIADFSKIKIKKVRVSKLKT